MPGQLAGFGEQPGFGTGYGAAAGAYGAAGSTPRKAIPDWLRDEMKKRNLEGTPGVETLGIHAIGFRERCCIWLGHGL